MTISHEILSSELVASLVLGVFSLIGMGVAWMLRVHVAIVKFGTKLDAHLGQQAEQQKSIDQLRERIVRVETTRHGGLSDARAAAVPG